MGTSSPYGGPGGGTPLVPSWLGGGPDGAPTGAPLPDGNPPQPGPSPDGAPPVPPPPRQPPDRTPPLPVDTGRYRTARTNFSRYARSGGNDRASLGRAVKGYVSTATGGARTAAQRMGSSRLSSAALVGFLNDVRTNGTRAALRFLNLEGLAGRPVEEIFLGLADYICPKVGTIDEAISRDAFIETIVDLADAGITNLDGLTVDQIQTFFELYAMHAIEARICNDIGTKTVTFPKDVQAAQRVHAGPRYFKSIDMQKEIFSKILKKCAAFGDKIITVHSVRAVKPVLDLIEENLPQEKGKIVLHWFTGSLSEARRAIDMGCYFSVNAEMIRNDRHRKTLLSLPTSRILTETDGPFTKTNDQPSKPKDVDHTVKLLSELYKQAPNKLMQEIQENLKSLLVES